MSAGSITWSPKRKACRFAWEPTGRRRSACRTVGGLPVRTVAAAQQVPDGRDLALPSDEGREQHREVVGPVGGRRAGHGAAQSVGSKVD